MKTVRLLLLVCSASHAIQCTGVPTPTEYLDLFASMDLEDEFDFTTEGRRTLTSESAGSGCGSGSGSGCGSAATPAPTAVPTPAPTAVPTPAPTAVPTPISAADTKESPKWYVILLAVLGGVGVLRVALYWYRLWKNTPLWRKWKNRAGALVTPPEGANVDLLPHPYMPKAQSLKL